MFQDNYAFLDDQAGFDGDEPLAKVVSSPRKIPSSLDKWSGEILTPDGEMNNCVNNNYDAQFMSDVAHPSNDNRDVSVVVSAETVILPDWTYYFTTGSAWGRTRAERVMCVKGAYLNQLAAGH